MKQRISIKIILILAIILMTGFIKTTSCYANGSVLSWYNQVTLKGENDYNVNAIIDHLNRTQNETNIQNKNKVTITNSDLKHSNYLFCREQGVSFSNTADYYLERPVIKYPIITYYTGKGYTGNVTTNIEEAQSVKVEGADIAYVLAAISDYGKASNSYLYGSVQRAYWGVLSGYQNSEIYINNDISVIENLLNNDSIALKLRQEAAAYQHYIEKVEAYKIEKEQEKYNIDVNEENCKIEYTTETGYYNDGSYKFARVGPLQVDYAGYWDSDNKIAFGSLTLTFKDENGEFITLDKNIKDDTKNQDGTNIATKGGKTDAIYFLYNVEYDENGDPFGQTSRARIDENGVLYTSTGIINAKNPFYIYINLDKVNTNSKISLCISSDYINFSADVYLLQGGYYGCYVQCNSDESGAIEINCLCDDCRQKYSNEDTVSINNETYIKGNTYYYWYPQGSSPAGCYYDINKGVYYGNAQLTGRTRSNWYYYCKNCGFKSERTYGHAIYGSCPTRGALVYTNFREYEYKVIFVKKIGCGNKVSYQYYANKGDTTTSTGAYTCGSYYFAKWDPDIWIDNQKIILTKPLKETETLTYNIEIPLTTSIEVTKNWSDYSNKYQLRPDTVSFNVYRSTNQNATTWEKLIENTDYKVEWKITTGNNWKAIIGGLKRTDNNGNKYYFKVEERPLDYYDVTRATYSSGSFTDGRVEDTEGQRSITIDNKLKYVKIGGYVWLDGQTGIKPAVPYNGNMDSSEEKLKDIVVYLYYKDPTTDVISRIAQTKTNSNGHYQFETKTRRR